MDHDVVPYRSQESMILFLTKGIFCFINIQGLHYGKMGKILDLNNSMKKIQVMLNSQGRV
jgi:hypothetical protein